MPRCRGVGSLAAYARRHRSGQGTRHDAGERERIEDQEGVAGPALHVAGELRDGIARQQVGAAARPVGIGRLVVPLGDRILVVGTPATAVRAPRVLVKQDQVLPGQHARAGQRAPGGVLVLFAAQRAQGGRGGVGGAQACAAVAVDRHLAGARPAAEVPVVGPVAAVRGELIPVRAHGRPPLGGQGDAQARPADGLVPRTHEGRDRGARGAVVAEGVVELQHQHREGVVALAQPAVDARPGLVAQPHGILVHPRLAREAVIPAVPGQNGASARPLPMEGIGPGQGRAAEVDVGGHGEGVDARVEQHVDERPVLAVDVAVHGVADGQAELLADSAQRRQRLDELVGVHERGDVEEHAGDLDAPAAHEVHEAGHLAIRGRAEPVQQHGGGLDGPAEGVVGVAVRVALAAVEGGVDEATMQVPDDRLVVCVADVGVAVMDQVDRLDARVHVRQLLSASRPPAPRPPRRVAPRLVDKRTG